MAVKRFYKQTVNYRVDTNNTFRIKKKKILMSSVKV